MPGTQKGSKRQISLYLSAPTAKRISAARGPHESLGSVVMRVLRMAHDDLVAELNAPEPEQTGPFPAPPRERRRLSVPDARPMSIRVSTVEAVAMRDVANKLDTSISQLVEDSARIALADTSRTKQKRNT